MLLTGQGKTCSSNMFSKQTVETHSPGGQNRNKTEYLFSSVMWKRFTRLCPTGVCLFKNLWLPPEISPLRGGTFTSFTSLQLDRRQLSLCSSPSDWLTKRFPVLIQRRGERRRGEVCNGEKTDEAKTNEGQDVFQDREEVGCLLRSKGGGGGGDEGASSPVLSLGWRTVTLNW